MTPFGSEDVIGLMATQLLEVTIATKIGVLGLSVKAHGCMPGAAALHSTHGSNNSLQWLKTTRGTVQASGAQIMGGGLAYLATLRGAAGAGEGRTH